MFKYTIVMWFGKSIVNIEDYTDDINEAIRFASLGLEYKNHIKIDKDTVVINPINVLIELYSPERIINIGNHLRGISGYLIRKRPEIYKKMKYFNRLFYYRIVSEEEIK